MKTLSTRQQIFLLLALCLAVIWVSAFRELNHSQSSGLREAESSVIFQSQIFAEHGEATIKRLDELLLDLRDYWHGDAVGFADLVRRRQAILSDIALQVAIIGPDGIMSFSNLSKPGKIVDLSEREHFRVHRDAAGGDRLFISQPVLGKVSGKWSIQFTRPILHGGKFDGVLVVSVSPDIFGAFHGKLGMSPEGVATVTRDGIIVAREPEGEANFGKSLIGPPFEHPDQAGSGRYFKVAQTDGIERLYGYYKLSEYHMSFIVGEPLAKLTASHREQREKVLITATITSLMAGLLIALALRSLNARDQATHALKASEARYRGFFQVNTAVKLVIDPKDGNILDANEAAVSYYGYPREKLLAMNIADINCLPSGELDQELNHARDSQRSYFTFRHRLASGEIRDVEVYTGPVELDDRRVIYSIVHDITERKQMEGELVTAKQAAEAASRAKSQFLATMSHEIRTPLNGILGMAQVLLMPGLEPKEQQEAARTILSSGQTLLTLLNDILDLSKVEAGKLELNHMAFDAQRLLDDTAQLFVESAKSRCLDLEVEWQSASGERYWGDPIRLRQMLSNLISNAVKFTEQGHVRIEGKARALDEKNAVLTFCVSDSGIGIPAERHHELFMPFSQVDSSSTRKFQGTGLGLSIIRRLAEQMGGQVGVESEPGKGSRFWFEIRVGIVGVNEESRQGPRPPSSAAPSRDGETTGDRKILVVEDNLTNRRVVEAILKRHGFAVRCAGDGAEAVEIITGEGYRPDAVLMDCQMPVMNGFDATREIRRWEQANGHAPLRIIALTAAAYDDDRQLCIDAGMDDFLAKPVDVKALLNALGSLSVETT